MDFGSYIREIRKSKNISLREAARRSEMSHPYLSQIETGKNTKPTPTIIKKLAKGLNVPYMQLMEKAGYADYSYETVAERLVTIDQVNKSQDLYALLHDNEDLYYNEYLLTHDDKKFLLQVMERTFGYHQ
ncbi:helix-turn-helix transcriptional regulator [Virgibacillus sp. NKC19-3]|uniref:helix-turn-helix domain-containing protein n=1 Tax=Virgibacillus saliphilus TaxID=2831674 RepID=UPI001C9A7287|nr:helix-turn-helix transcriptional regulator [Virgibacillus sp. NKC19-3]MBY7142443.1 helix-turn-helix transcriptional regulator [Virgibacillus sp. NKC19-3]